MGSVEGEEECGEETEEAHVEGKSRSVISSTMTQRMWLSERGIIL